MAVSLVNKLDALCAEFSRRIASGEWAVGERVPTEERLVREFGCARATVTRAMERLVQRGLIERRPRLGTRVVRRAEEGAASLQLDACAFIHPSDEHEGVWRTGRGFRQAAQGAGRRTLMLSTGTDFRREAEVVGRLAEFDVKGAVLFPVILSPHDYGFYTQMILACPFPIVLVEMSLAGVRRPSVTGDGIHAGYTMTRHLLASGRTKVGFLANYAWAAPIRDRYLGYRQAMEEAGLGHDTALAHLEPDVAPCFADPVAEPERVADRYLRDHPEVEAVVASSDFLALGLVRAARKLGRRMPDDLAVTGIDDFAVAAEGDVPLTTYRVPYEKIGARALEILHDLVAGRPAARMEEQVRGEIVVRASAP